MLFSVLAFTACTNPDHNDEAVALSREIVNNGLSDVEHSVERVDSAEQAGLFTAIRANITKAIIYENADRRRLAAYYAEKAIAAEAGHAVATSADSSLYWEQMLTAYANGNRYAVPVVMLDGEKYYMVQTRDWHIGQPLANWLSPNMLRSEEDRQAHWGEDIILMNEKGEFRRLSKEEGQKVALETPGFTLNANSREIETAPSASYLWYLQPQVYNDTVKRFEEFINKK